MPYWPGASRRRRWFELDCIYSWVEPDPAGIPQMPCSAEGYMGFMNCKTHGRVAFVESCSHVARQIDDANFPSGRRFTILTHRFVCDDCYDLLGFDRFVGLAGLPAEQILDDAHADLWEAFEAAYILIEGRRLFCLACLEELERKSTSP
jgi:hypothetical protein